MGQLVRPSGPRAAVDGVEAGPAEWPWGLCEPGQFAGSAVRVVGPQAATRSDGRKRAPVTRAAMSVYLRPRQDLRVTVRLTFPSSSCRINSSSVPRQRQLLSHSRPLCNKKTEVAQPSGIPVAPSGLSRALPVSRGKPEHWPGRAVHKRTDTHHTK